MWTKSTSKLIKIGLEILKTHRLHIQKHQEYDCSFSTISFY